MRKTGFSIVCLVIGFLLGPMFEMALRQTMLMYKSDLSVMVTTPIPAVFVILTVIFAWKFGVSPKKKKAPAESSEAGQSA